MKTRVLPAEEWSRLDAIGAPRMPGVSADDMAIVVVEDDAGQVVASMNVLRAVHYEGVWISPEHRNAGVTRALLSGAAETASREWVFVDVVDPEMAAIVGRLGGFALPVSTYVLPTNWGGKAWPR